MGVPEEPVQQESVPPCLHIITDKTNNRSKEKVSAFTQQETKKTQNTDGSTYMLSLSVGVHTVPREEGSSKSESKPKMKDLIFITNNSGKTSKNNVQKNTAHKTAIN